MASVIETVNEARFWATADRSGANCWLWLGHTHKGYGRYGGILAPRLAYTLTVGPIPAGLTIDHRCRTPLCVNPDHLEVVTFAENQRRRSGARTACVNGHALSPENTYRWQRGRACRACRAAADRRRKMRKVT